MPNTPRLISNQEFFDAHYRSVTETIGILAYRLNQIRDSTALIQDIRPALEAILDLCDAIVRVLQGQSLAAREVSISGVLAAFEAAAQVAEQACGNETVMQAAHLVREHTDFFKTHFDPQLDYSEGAFSDISKKQLLFAMAFNSAQILLVRVMNAFLFSSADPREATSFFDYKSVLEQCPPASLEVIEKCQAGLEGWCSDAKTWLLYHLVRQERPETAVEIGIYGGRSIVPIAQAMHDNGIGTVTGIEAWAAAAATEQITDFANDFWWSCIDYSVLKEKFLRFVIKSGLIRQIRIIEAPSRYAHHCVGPIDFLHIDGNHSAFSASQDVINYFSKLKPGGILVFDDINWPSTHPALAIVMKSCQLLHVTSVSEESPIPGCAAFRKL